MKNVLIVTQRFPPINHIASRRFGYMVGYMQDFGWTPWIVAQTGEGDLPVTIPEAQIARIAGSDPPRSAGFGPRILRSLRYRTKVFQTSWYWDVRAHNHLVDAFPKPDVILASYGPTSALWIGRYFSKRYRVPWVADFRDPDALRYAGRLRLSRHIDQATESAVLRSAAAITTPSTIWSSEMGEAYGKRTETIYNGYMWPGDNLNHAGEVSEDSEYIYYAGTVYAHQLPAFRIVLDAIAERSDMKLRLRLLGVREAVEQITQWASEPAICELVELLPRTSAAIALAEANAALSNLVLGDLKDESSWTRGHLTGKFLELIALKPPVLVVANRESEFDNVIDRVQRGIVCDSLPQVISYLDEVSQGQRWPGDPDAVAVYSKRHQCAALCNFLDTVTSDSR